MRASTSVSVYLSFFLINVLINAGFVVAQKSSDSIFDQMVSAPIKIKISEQSSIYDNDSGFIILPDTNIILPDTIIVSKKKCNVEDVEIYLPKSIPDFDINDVENWQYVLIDTFTGDTIQFSHNYLPKPKHGVKGNKKKDGYSEGKIGNIHVLKPMNIGIYFLVRSFDTNEGKLVELNQMLFINEIIPPTPVLVDYSAATFSDGKIELKARWFDKGGCGKGCIASYDNCTDKEGLKFTFSNKLPAIDNDSNEYVNQLIQFNKVFFNPQNGAIMTENDYNRGIAHAWIPQENTSSRIFVAEKMNKDVTQYKIKVFVWDSSAENESFKEKNFSFGEVKIEFKF